MAAELRTLFDWPKNDLFDVIDIFWYTFRYLNLIQYRVHKVQIDHKQYKRYVEVNLWYWTKFCIVISVYLLLIYYHVRGETLFKTNTAVFDYGNQLFLVAVYGVLIFFTANNMILRTLFWNMFVKLHGIDTRMKIINFPINHNTEYIFLTSTFCLSILYLIGTIIYLISTGNFTWVQIMFETFPVLLYCAVLFLCYGLMVIFVYRFKALNRAFKYYFVDGFEDDGRFELKLKGIERHFELIYCIRRLYADLCYCMDTLMFCTGVSFIFTLLTWFSAYCVYYLDSSKSTERTIICIFLLNLSVTYILLLILGSGEVLKLEGLKTLKIINMAMIKFKANNDMCYEMIKFSQQIRHKHPIFTCGLFPFDLTLINSFISGLVTYLIILIQFQTSNMI